MAKTLANITGIPPEVRTFTESPAVADSGTFVGIELEIEHSSGVRRRANNLSLWQQTAERSLRNDGAEFITPPVRGQDIVSAIEELRSVLTSLPPADQPEVSGRTGLHVHIDFRGESIQTLFRFVVTYLVFEKYLFSLCEPGRDENAYCVPLSSCEDVLANLPKLLSRSESTIRGYLDRYPKYTALNLKPLRNLGTIEVRMHEGTVDPDQILRWVNTLLSIKAFAANVSASPQTLIDRVCEAPEEYYSDVFGIHQQQAFSNVLYEGMLDGARAAQYMYRTKAITENLLSTDGNDSFMGKLYKQELNSGVAPAPRGPEVIIDDLAESIAPAPRPATAWATLPERQREALERAQASLANTSNRRVR